MSRKNKINKISKTAKELAEETIEQNPLVFARLAEI
jgi:hypothetical protein